MVVTELIDGELGAPITCRCCKNAAGGFSVAAGADAADKLPAFLATAFPPGTTVAVAYADDGPFVAVKRALLCHGYRIFPLKTGDFTVAEAQGIRLPEHVRAAVAVNCADIMKYYGAMTGLPVWCVVTEPDVSVLTPAATLKCGTLRVFRTPPPKGVVAITRPFDAYAVGLGRLASAVVAVFDGFACSRFQRAPFCPESAATVLGVAAHVCEALKKRLSPEDAANLVFTTCLKVSAVGALVKDARYWAGSVFAATSVIDALCAKEERPGPSAAECAVLLPPLLLRWYAGALREPERFVPPPDNNRRMDALETLLGLSGTAAARSLSPVMDESELRRARYILRASVREVDAVYRRCLSAVDSLFYAFRRLAPDRGYSLTDKLDARDAELAFSLAPDVSGRFTFLTYMKNLGLLDGYLDFVV